MQRLTGTISWHRMAHPNGPGADRTGVFTADENGASREGAAQSSTGKSRILFDSRLSRGARTSDNEEGETRVSALGVNYIIKY